MKKLLLPMMISAMVALPAMAHAEECRDSASGRFAKCGAPGAVPASQYVKHTTTKSKAKTAAPAPAATASSKPSFMSRMMGKSTPAPTPTATPAKTTKAAKTTTAAKPATVRCKKGSKFAKCGTPGAVPVS